MLITCVVCGAQKNTSPSKVSKRSCCSRECQVHLTLTNLEAGKAMRYKKGITPNAPEHYQKLALLLKNDGHPKWKGEKVSYRGLHQWVRRNKGHGKKCATCGFESDLPRMIQWANRDGKYRRNLDDFFPLCCSCHKIHDRQLRGLQWKGLRGKPTPGGRFASR